MRDVLIVPFDDKQSIVIASDNSGGIGAKERDHVHVPYETVGYFCFRVAAMECISAGGEPFAITIQNFCGEEAWDSLLSGIRQGLRELALTDVKITGSTESNFSLEQSALGITVFGKKRNKLSDEPVQSAGLSIAVIGTPLVGDEVIQNQEKIVPLSVFRKLSLLEDVVILPVGSKGILSELNNLFADRIFSVDHIRLELDVLRSSGPSTCFIIAFPAERKFEIKQLSGQYFHEIVEVSK